MVIHLNDDYDDSIVEFASNNCSRNILHHVKFLKEEGNAYFKNGEVIDAGERYDRGLKFLCFVSPRTGEENSLFWNLAISLELNLATCALKVHDYDQTKELCSLVIKYDGCNAKAFYRRALAEAKLFQIEEAYEDLSKAAKVEPNNHDILRELENIKGLLREISKLKSGREVQEIDEDLGKVVGLGPKKAHGKRSNMSTHPTHPTHIKKGKVSEVSISGTDSVVMGNDEQSGLTNITVTEPVIEMEVESSIITNNAFYPLVSGEEASSYSKNNKGSSHASDHEVGTTYSFSNSRRTNQSLKIPYLSYFKLQQGKTMNFFNTSTGSWMTLRVKKSTSPNRYPSKFTNTDSTSPDVVSVPKEMVRSVEKKRNRDNRRRKKKKVSPPLDVDQFVDNGTTSAIDFEKSDDHILLSTTNYSIASTCIEKGNETPTNDFHVPVQAEVESVGSNKDDPMGLEGDLEEPLILTPITFIFSSNNLKNRRFGRSHVKKRKRKRKKPVVSHHRNQFCRTRKRKGSNLELLMPNIHTEISQPHCIPPLDNHVSSPPMSWMYHGFTNSAKRSKSVCSFISCVESVGS